MSDTTIPFVETFDTLFDGQLVEQAIGSASILLNIVPSKLTSGIRRFRIKNLILHESIASPIIYMYIRLGSIKLTFKLVALNPISLKSNDIANSIYTDTYITYDASTVNMVMLQHMSTVVSTLELRLSDHLKRSIDITPFKIINELPQNEQYAGFTKIMNSSNNVYYTSEVPQLPVGSKIYLLEHQVVFTFEIN